MAKNILSVTEETSREEIVKKYGSLFENNAKNGSFYLQSKVHRAKECLEALILGFLLSEQKDFSIGGRIVVSVNFNSSVENPVVRNQNHIEYLVE
ncbi:hypothetical protein JHK85_010809 [Glycine max]|nr:hypothetical protein JHK85_010809 [Glycine max]